MKGLQEKLRSRSGASILMALLFLLVCMMVAASVLMAAASNAGKLRSNREEQQQYLTVSSALRLICDELEGSSYVGKYSYKVEKVYKTVTSEGEDGTTTSDLVLDHYKHTYAQTVGTYDCGLNSDTAEVLPLQDILDTLFGRKFRLEKLVNRNPNDEYIFTRQEIPVLFFPVKYNLIVKADDFAIVNVDFEMREDGLITLTASLTPKNSEPDSSESDSSKPDKNEHIYAMRAELEPVTPLDKVLDLRYSDLESEDENGVEYRKTGELKWRLNWIDKEVEAP